ncbi:hypothetical protein M1247_09855 [Mycobacterium sp. 21AC1]|uniref:hypothetical protein n=1 Tax=[Mycobacterium] appelbergii TaxID=2939269 RepID=UPI0029394AAD|nr:hypothetical protein [Mycobacterium sp. 21AC1]MDV3125213.1 hypothetical protein [Mycobacterium sp. 21AC1]
MLHVPSAQIMISRRRALFSAAALALVGAAAACGSKPPPPELADLTAQLDRARADSKLATDAAAALPPQSPQTRALTAVATERRDHAQALSDELVRMTGDSAESFEEPSTTETSDAPKPPPAVRDVVDALKESAQSTTDLAAKLSGYRAGLLGSIAASCTAAYSVALGGAR